MMLQYGWPGNVRELDHTIERAVLMARESGLSRGPGLNAQRAAAQSMDDMSLEAVEAILIRKALARAGGNVSHAADALGLSRGALYRRIEKYGSEDPDGRQSGLWPEAD
jgi:DNA-binding NtrC family response regulator